MLDFRPYARWGLTALLVVLTGSGCFRPPEPSEGARPAAGGVDRAVMVGNLMTDEQMEALVAGQGCFGLTIPGVGCCSLVIQNYGWLWSLRIAGIAEMLAAFIDGRSSYRCF